MTKYIIILALVGALLLVVATEPDPAEDDIEVLKVIAGYKTNGTLVPAKRLLNAVARLGRAGYIERCVGGYCLTWEGWRIMDKDARRARGEVL